MCRKPEGIRATDQHPQLQMCCERVSCDDASDNYDDYGDYDHAGVVMMAEKHKMKVWTQAVSLYSVHTRNDQLSPVKCTFISKCCCRLTQANLTIECHMPLSNHRYVVDGFIDG